MNTIPTVVEDRSGSTGYSPRGAARDLWLSKRHEVIMSGPAETGKTYSCLQKLDALMWRYPRSQGLMVRKTYKSIVGSALQTYTRKVLCKDSPVTAYGGERPDWFDYPNGSRLYVGGMDNADKVLSSERDFIYVNQAEELSLDDWEKLTTRATGRAGNAPYAQIMGDCNPGPQHHWIKQRHGLLLLESRHEDNPILYTPGGKLTPQGEMTIAVLDALTGVRKERLRYGRWVSAEGAVYQFDPRIHLIDPFKIPSAWTRVRSIDFGYTNPFCCLWGAIDPDGRIIIYRELYHSQRTVSKHAVQIKAHSGDETYSVSVSDHDAEDRATLHENGIYTQPALKAITVGIQAVESRLALAADGKPRLLIMRDTLIERDDSLSSRRLPVCLTEEFDAYMWPKGVDGKAIKEVPVDKDNHALDALRYLTMWADDRQRGLGGTVGASRRPNAMEELRSKGVWNT